MRYQLIPIPSKKQQIDLAAGNFVPDTDGTHLHIEGSVAMNDNATETAASHQYTPVSIQAVSLTAANSNVTVTDASTLYISGPSTASSVSNTYQNSYFIRGRYQSSW